MDTKLSNEISRLDNIKDFYKQSYISNLDYCEDKIDRINNKLENTSSSIKKEILTAQRQQYQKEIEDLDKSLEKTLNEIEQKIEMLQNKRKELEEELQKERESFDFNIEKLRSAIDKKNIAEMFKMFEYTANALTILRNE
jgi:predicted  nucleic acid-binding Zn-ribbon protein